MVKLLFYVLKLKMLPIIQDTSSSKCFCNSNLKLKCNCIYNKT